MSDEGDKTCPLCAEAMDPTDQQLKPCKCGYEICVWCWHHIMEMAEKDDTEGRCPACRTPYNKEKIVGMAAKCERLGSEVNMEKKPKFQKGKSKPSEGRKQLGSVRVIQRNLVYVVGLPSHLAVEDILQRREYFGQYGKVLKVSISRPTNGAIQQFANSTCSVYITYSKEEEAVRCIQFVHGFLLDGKPLRACFGTTKYCHAWLRNVPCSNPDCLYLHEIGSQEDSFTKDEIISSYTRNRVQQITGSSYITQRHSGNVLPSPTDDNLINSSAFPGKPASKTAANNHSFAGARVSSPNSNSGGSATHLTAPSWGCRPSSNQPLLTSTACLSGPQPHQKPNMHDGQSAFPKAVLSTSPVSQLQNDTGKRVVPDEESSISSDRTAVETSEPVNTQSNTDGSISVSDISVASVPLHHVSLSIQRLTPPTTILSSDTPNTYTAPSSMPFSESVSDKDFTDDNHGNIDNACSVILSMSIHENQKPQNGYAEQINPLICQASGKAVNITEVHNPTVPSDFISGLPTQSSQVHLQLKEDDSFSFGNGWLEDPQVVINRVPDNSHATNLSNYSSIRSPRANNDGIFSTKLGMQGVDNSNLLASISDFPSGHPENILDSWEFDDAIHSKLSPSKEVSYQLGSYEGKVGSTPDIGESSIISNILSMDFDPWNESAISPWNLFGETEKQQGFSGVRGSRKTQNSSQSMFAFAREDDPNTQVSYFGQSSGQYVDAFKDRPFLHNFSSSTNMRVEKFVRRSNLPVLRGTEPDTFTSSHSYLSSNQLLAPRSQIPAPPGFSVPSRPPPPGFSTLEKIDHIFESASGHHITDTSSPLRNQYEAHSSGSIYSNGEVEFDDPAILAVGKGTVAHNAYSPGIDTRFSLPPQLSSYEDSRLQPVPQRSLPPHQSQKFTGSRDHFTSLGDAYGAHSRILEQKLSNNFSPFPQFSLPQSSTGITANGPWSGWNEAQSASNNVGVAELLRTERLGFNHFYSGYEDSTIQMPSSGNLYNSTYGI